MSDQSTTFPVISTTEPSPVNTDLQFQFEHPGLTVGSHQGVVIPPDVAAAVPRRNAANQTTIEEKAAILRLRAACAGLTTKQIERLIADYLKGQSA